MMDTRLMHIHLPKPGDLVLEPFETEAIGGFALIVMPLCYWARQLPARPVGLEPISTTVSGGRLTSQKISRIRV